ncbi:MAG: glutamate--tRNA ligase family protein [bacterium]|nr:glutamate--tRNA ligase family protein [bacterium]
MNNSKPVKTRFAPSPTGLLHIGGLRTCLINYIYAKQNKGTFVLRIEDTDKKRSKKEFENEIITSFELMGIFADEVYRQSERSSIHRSYITSLIETGQAYISKELSDSEDSREEVIRFKNPNKIISFDDVVRGNVEIDTTDLGDFVIAKSLEEPLYHLAVVTDDFEMGITHIIRGEEHIANTPRQILIQEAIGAPRPVYVHLPLILATDKSKLSKRHGAVAVTSYIEEGYLPAAIINYLALLGWSPQSVDGADASDVLTLDEIIAKYDMTKVQKGGAVFNIEKLNDLNAHYIKQLGEAVLEEKIKHWLPSEYTEGRHTSKEVTSAIAKLFAERIHTFGEIKTLLGQGEFTYLFKPISYDADLLLGKKKDLPLNETISILEQLIALLDSVPLDDFNPEHIKNSIWDFAEKMGRGNVLWPMRTALTGAEKSADPFSVAGILGKQETLTRLKDAETKLTA